MAHFAELDQNNVVLRVIVIGDDVLKDETGSEHEQHGIDFCKQLFGQDTVWKQTSYNTIGGKHADGKTPFRKNYAGIGFIYDPQRDAFIAQKPEGDGWSLDEEQCIWTNPELEAARLAAQLEVSYIEPVQSNEPETENVEPSN